MLIWALVLSLFACKDKEEEIVYAQFNADGDALTIDVGVDELAAPESIVLHSSTGAVEVGTAEVDPGGGPVGTEHTITVEVYDDWQDQVVRATLRTDSGERGEDEYEMEGDSADEGLYRKILVSAGSSDELREDTFTIRLWEEEGADVEDQDTPEGGDTEDEEEGGDTGETGDSGA